MMAPYSAACLKKTAAIGLVLVLTGLCTPAMLRAQDEDAMTNLMEQMTALVERSGTAGDPDALHGFSTILQSPDFQALVKSVLASSNLGGLGGTGPGSGASRNLTGILSYSLVDMILLVFLANALLARILFAVNVFINARRLTAAGTPPLFMGPTLWALAVVIGGMLLVVLYWLMHHSTLSKLQQKSQA